MTDAISLLKQKYVNEGFVETLAVLVGADAVSLQLRFTDLPDPDRIYDVGVADLSMDWSDPRKVPADAPLKCFVKIEDVVGGPPFVKVAWLRYADIF